MTKINLDLPAIPIRELRLNSITGYQGDAAALVNAGRCGLKDQERSFS